MSLGSTPQSRARLFQLLPHVQSYIAGLPRCRDGDPDWHLYSSAKLHLSEYVGWEAEAVHHANLAAEDREWLSGSAAYEAMIDALVDHINV